MDQLHHRRIRFLVRAVVIAMVALLLVILSYHALRLNAMWQVKRAGGFVSFRLASGEIPIQETWETLLSADAECVYLASTQLQDRVLAQLKFLPELKMLSFNRTSFSDEHLRHLGPLPNLRELQLNGTNITNDGLRLLAENHRLELLTLNDTGIGDLAVVHLASMTSLKKLHLRHTRFSEESIAILHKALPQCEIVHAPPAHDELPSKLDGSGSKSVDE